MKDYYSKNMRMLKKSNKSLYRRMQNYQKSEEFEIKKDIDNEEVIALVNDIKNDIKIFVENTKSNDKTITVKKEDRDIYFHSKYDPIREAKRKIKKFKPKNDEQIFSLGFGLGYHLNELAKRNKYDKLIIIEPYMSIFYTALKYLDLSDILNSDKVIFVIGGEPKLFDVIRASFSLTLEKELSFLEHNPSHKLFETEYKKIYHQIREGINFKKVTLTTNIKSARKWRNNIIANLPYIFKSPKADDFFNEFKDIPAICVSAGPSLDKNINDIKKAKGKALIMCVGTSLKPLLKEGIKPDIVVSVDGNFANYRHFEDIDKIPDSYLFAELANHYKIQQKWNNKQVFLTMKRNFSRWIENLKGKYTTIQTGGTVAHSMVDLAYKMGADPIVLVGQDLAYEKGKTHASGTTYEGDKVESKNLLEVESVYGDKVKTDKSFLSMLSYFNNYFSKRPNRTYIDATEGGAKIENTKIIELSEVINKYCKNEIDINVKEVLENKFNNYKNDIDNDILKEAIEDILKELDEAISLSSELLQKVSKMENKIKHSTDIQKLSPDKFENKIKKYEKKLKKLNAPKYCTERILIVEAMKYKEVKSKYYIDENKAFKEKMKYYRTYRARYLDELKKCRKLFIDLYVKKSTDKREGLA